MVLLKINESASKAAPHLLCSVWSHSALLSLSWITAGGAFRCFIAVNRFTVERENGRIKMNEFPH